MQSHKHMALMLVNFLVWPAQPCRPVECKDAACLPREQSCWPKVGPGGKRAVPCSPCRALADTSQAQLLAWHRLADSKLVRAKHDRLRNGQTPIVGAAQIRTEPARAWAARMWSAARPQCMSCAATCRLRRTSYRVPVSAGLPRRTCCRKRISLACRSRQQWWHWWFIAVGQLK